MWSLDRHGLVMASWVCSRWRSLVLQDVELWLRFCPAGSLLPRTRRKGSRVARGKDGPYRRVKRGRSVVAPPQPRLLCLGVERAEMRARATLEQKASEVRAVARFVSMVLPEFRCSLPESEVYEKMKACHHPQLSLTVAWKHGKQSETPEPWVLVTATHELRPRNPSAYFRTDIVISCPHCGLRLACHRLTFRLLLPSIATADGRLRTLLRKGDRIGLERGDVMRRVASLFSFGIVPDTPPPRRKGDRIGLSGKGDHIGLERGDVMRRMASPLSYEFCTEGP